MIKFLKSYENAVFIFKKIADDLNE